VVAAVTHAVTDPTAWPQYGAEEPSVSPVGDLQVALHDALRQQDLRLLRYSAVSVFNKGLLIRNAVSRKLIKQGASSSVTDQQGRSALFSFATTPWSSVHRASQALTALRE
jgi:hypothetical protein